MKNKHTKVLTLKQENFCLKYIELENATEAYKQSYATGKMLPATISRKTADVMGNLKIKARIAELKRNVEKIAVVDAAQVLRRHAEIDAMDITDILNPDWTFKPLKDWPKVWKISISGIDVQELRAGMTDPDAATAFIKKIKWPDKLKNLEALGKHVDVQAYVEQVNNNTSVEITEIRRVIIDERPKQLD